MKKVMAGIAAAVSLCVIMTTTAFAAPSDSGGRAAAQRSICSIADCTKTYGHSHNGEFYCGHRSDDGHGHDFALCGMENCTLDYDHTHVGASYRGHANGDGHAHSFDSNGVRVNCDIEGCGMKDDHAHNGVDYNGHQNGDGHGHKGSTSSDGSFGPGRNNHGNGGGHNGNGGRHR